MNIVTITKGIVCAGFNGEPSIRYSTTSSGEKSCQFKIGEEIYDAKAENKKRYNNWRVRAFGETAERIEKMNLSPGSRINFVGKLDVYTYTDENGKNHEQVYIVIQNIEYASAPKKKEDEEETKTETKEVKEEVPDALSDCKVVDLGKENPFSPGSLFGI